MSGATAAPAIWKTGTGYPPGAGGPSGAYCGG